MRELSGVWKSKVRRFRIIYEIDRNALVMWIFAIGHRWDFYEELTSRIGNQLIDQFYVP